jgi:hypothetical protein
MDVGWYAVRNRTVVMLRPGTQGQAHLIATSLLFMAATSGPARRDRCRRVASVSALRSSRRR